MKNILFLLAIFVIGCGELTDHGGECWAMEGKQAAVAIWQDRAVAAGHKLLTKEEENNVLKEPVFVVTQDECQDIRHYNQYVSSFRTWEGIYICSAYPSIKDGPNVPTTEKEMVNFVVHQSMHYAWYFSSDLPNDWYGDSDPWFLEIVEIGRVEAQKKYLECI